MSIIIRLQNLPWSANSVDIRKFFQGLSIPDGGVHIVGGEKGDAFIAFASDEDARLAMDRDGGKIREAQIKLLLSSRNEMQRVIDQARSGIVTTGGSEPDKVSSGIPPEVLVKHAPPLTSAPPAIISRNNVPQDRSRARSRSPLSRLPANNSSLSQIPPQMQSLPQSRPQLPQMQSPMSGLMPLAAAPLRAFPADPVPLNIEVQRQNGQEGMQWTRRVTEYGNGRPLEDNNRIENAYAVPASLTDPRANGMVRVAEPLGREIDLNGRRVATQLPISQVAAVHRLELRGLPFNVTPRDIQDFFRLGVGMYVADDKVKILVDERGLTTGGATVRVANEADLRSALALNGRLMGDRCISVMPLLEDISAVASNDIARLADRQPIIQPIAVPPPALVSHPPPQQVPQPQQQPPPQVLPQRDYVIYMKGIPFNACTDRDVGNFFQNLRITEIVFEVDRHTGKPAGNAFVEFPTREDYEGALELNLRHMGRRYIEVFPTTRDDMEEARRVASGAEMEKPTHCVSVTGLPPSITNADLTSYFKEIGAVPYAIHIMLKANGLNAGEAFLEFSSAEHQRLAASRDGDVISNSRISVKEVPFHVMRKVVGRPLVPPVGPRNGNDFRPNFEDRRPFGNRDRFEDRRGGGRGGGGRGGRGISPNRRRDPFADARCVVHASNVPYKATNEELQNFFAEYATVEGGIERRMNERGMATPEARIAFRSSLEAERAVKAMHKKFIQGRPVFLRLAV